MRLAALAMLFAGCAQPTTLLLDIAVASGEPAPPSLTVTVLSPAGTLADHITVTVPSLPGRLVVRALPDIAQTLEVIVDAGAFGACPRAQVKPHAQVEVPVSLTVWAGESICLPQAPADLGMMADLAQGDFAVEKSCATLGRSVLLCDDFEAAAIDTTTWASDGHELLDAIHVHRGLQALHATNPAVLLNTGMAGAQLVERKTFAAMTGNTLYVRIWAFAPTAPASGNDERLFAVQQDGSQYYGLGAFLYSTNVTLDDWYAAVMSSSTGPPTYGQWACYRAQIVLDQINGSFALTGTNTPSVSLPPFTPTQTTAPMAPFAEVAIGPYTQHPPNPQPAFELWIDDVIIDDHPVDCSD